jgi:sterol desaturase/sphingolipid hydroxylase (fatty acid hydroxylase superfamily)
MKAYVQSEPSLRHHGDTLTAWESKATTGSMQARPGNLWHAMLVYVPLIVALVVGNAMWGRLSLWEWITLPVAGLLLWTLLEYVIHAFAFHPRWLSGWLKNVQHSHAMHHAYPKRPEYIVARLSFTVPIAAALFALLWLVTGDLRWASLILVGAVAGYLTYEVVHWSIHRRWGPRILPRSLVLHHLYHHYKDDQSCYGVTSPLWDVVFGTSRHRKSRKPNDTNLRTTI